MPTIGFQHLNIKNLRTSDALNECLLHFTTIPPTKEIRMMSRTKLIALLAVTALIVPLISTSVEFSADDSDYEIKEIETYRPNEDEPTMKEYRIYSDMPNVPFITLDGLYNIYSGKEMKTTFSDGKVTYINPINTEVTATIDTGTWTFKCDNYSAFKAPLTEEDRNARFMQSTAEAIHEETTKTIAIGDYDIPLYFDDGNIWMPVQTAADLFLSPFAYYTYCIPELICCITVYESLSGTPAKLEAVIQKEIEVLSYETVRSADLVDLTYKEFCLVIDNNYGKPDTAALGKELQKSKLDDVLNNYNESTKKIASWLQSDDYVEYIAGLTALGAYLNDGGHTSFPVLNNIVGDERKAEVINLLNTIDVPEIRDKGTIMNKLKEARTNVLGPGDYHESGDTAMFTFDSFVTDLEGWENYYDNKGELPKDTYGSVIAALEKAKKNPNIKNFIFDVTTNSGGDSSPCLAIISIMTGDYSYMYNKFVDTELSVEMKSQIDTNLDGKFDEKDLKKQYDFNFAILCTNNSFSSGNLLPVYAKERGIMIMGETSGGGCFAMSLAGTADGLFGTISTTYGLSDSKWNSVESGAAPDVVLVDTNSDSDLKALYDMEKLSSAMNEFYSGGSDNVIIIVVAVVIIGVLLIAAFLKFRN